MAGANQLYQSHLNPLLLTPARGLPREMAVIGAGTIGPDIGYYLKSALPAAKLHLVDIAPQALEQARARLEGYAQKAVDKRKMKPEQASAVLENINYTSDYGELAGAELVIEAATESIPLKQKIFAQVEGVVGPEAVITSNTSSIPADRIFSSVERPQRTAVTHFFAPAWRSLPVELAGWDKTSQETMDWLFWFLAETGKAPIITANAICFMLDRVFDNWCNEAAFLLDQATAAQVDRVAEELVFAGPFFVLNMANGNPIIIETNTLQMEEGEHYRPAPVLASVAKWNTPRPGTKTEVDDETKALVRDRLLGILFSQSFDILDRGIGTRADLNFGCQVALGFRHGPLDVMRRLGPLEVERVMAEFQRARPGFPAPREEAGSYTEFPRFVLTDRVDDVVVITIRRPQAMNALSDEVNDEILGVLQAYADDPEVKGFVITGYGKQAFSAGADIGRFPSMLGDFEASAQYARDCAKVQAYMDRMAKPVVAAVNGVALGGGLELAIRCHGLVASPHARFGFPEIGLGILPGIGGCVVPYRRWPQGAERFNRMLCLGEQINANQARELGMVSQVVEGYPELIRAAAEKARALAGRVPRIPEEPAPAPELEEVQKEAAASGRLSPEAVGVAAGAIRAAAAAPSLAEALEIGYQGFGKIACTEAAQEGISAFLQRRKPEFKK
jgi:enoyl-CoA hydratase/3-hydroxyacyl-CoA dehydrogenase